MSRHQTERNQFNRRIKPDSRFAPLPHEGEVRNEEEPCLTTPKDACGVLERFSRSSKQVLSGTENVGSVFRIMRRAEDAPAVAAAAPARRPPATAATLKHVIVGADGKPLPPLFDFSEDELRGCTPEMRAKLVPEWYRGEGAGAA